MQTAALNDVVHALDLNGDGSVSKEELLTAVANNREDGPSAHISFKQMKMGQAVVQVRPVIGGKVEDGVVKGLSVTLSGVLGTTLRIYAIFSITIRVPKC